MADIGLRLVDSLYEQLMVDDQWALRRERGFTWWSYRLAQHVEVAAPVWSVDRYVCAVQIWTEVVHEVDTTVHPARVVGAMNSRATLNALVCDGATATVAECCTAQVHEEIFDWMSKVLATAAVLQNTAAHSRAHSLARACGGVPAATTHPASGERPEMDDLLNVPEVIANEGDSPSRFEGAPMERVGGFLERMEFLGSAEPTRLTCQVPFTARAPSAVAAEAGQPQTSLVQIFADAPHPEVGNGALIVMRLPLSAEPDWVAFQANELNAAEVQGDSQNQFLGAWCPDPNNETTLAFCSFVPNALARWVAMEHMVSYQGGRSRFAAERLAR
jgi:hypothetical protein